MSGTVFNRDAARRIARAVQQVEGSAGARASDPRIAPDVFWAQSTEAEPDAAGNYDAVIVVYQAVSDDWEDQCLAAQ